jgi:cellulose synthase/poly-beta-1,6-N-acetylglucosamine synthase-like glycosyltransferase
MYVPSPPSHQQKLLYLNSGKKEIYLFSGLSTLVLVTGMFLFVKGNPWFLPYTIFSLVTFFYLLCTYFVGIFGKEFDYTKHLKLVSRHLDSSSSEHIDIFLPVCGEDIGIIRNTWEGVSKLRAAHEGRITVNVLDDGWSDEIKRMAEVYNFRYIRRPDRAMKKAGNLRYAFRMTSAPFFIVLDADFVPRADFIINMMPYFYEDDDVCIVQSPQFFEVTANQTAIQKGAGAIQELFYRLVQVNRDTFDGAICVGSNAIYRRRHLEPHGGTAEIGYSEDVRSGVRISFDGKKVRYIPLNLAMGTCPETWQGLFTQYYRWSMGSLSLLFSKEFWVNRLSLSQRICYLSGMFYYLTTGLYSIFYFVPSMYLLIFKPEYIHWYNLLFSLPSLLFGVFYMKYWMKQPYGLDALRVRHVSYYAHFYALKDYLLGTLEEWKPTGARTSSQRYQDFVFVYTFITLLVPILTVLLITLRVVEGHDPVNFALLLLFTGFNYYIAKKPLDEI